MRCFGIHHWAPVNNSGWGQNDRKPAGPLTMSWPLGEGWVLLWAEVTEVPPSPPFLGVFTVYFHLLAPLFLLISTAFQVGTQPFPLVPQFKEVAGRGCNLKTFIHSFCSLQWESIL